MVGVSSRIRAVRHAIDCGVSQRRACQLLGVARSMLTYRHRQPEKDRALRHAIAEVAGAHPAWGYRLVAGWLREHGAVRGVKRVRRLWRLGGYTAHWRKRHKKRRTGARLNPVPHRPNSVWCMDFAEDRLENGRRFCALLVKDEASAFCVGLPVARSFKAIDVERILDELVTQYGKPEHVRCDNGGQFVAYVVQRWAARHRVHMAHIAPGKPWQNGAAESLVATYRREILDAELFHTLAEAQVISERWRRMYNEQRPHSRLSYRPPATAYRISRTG